MELCTLALTLVLAGQLPGTSATTTTKPTAADTKTAASAAVTQPDTGAAPAPSDGTRQEARALEVLNDAHNLPPEVRSRTRSITLLETISQLQDRRARVAGAQAYWNLWAAGAQFRFSRDEVSRVEGWRAGVKTRPEQMQIESALAGVRARAHEADAALVQAQYALAEQLRWQMGAPLPIAADPPHVGAYETNFDKLFTAANAPYGLVQIDQSLPIERSLIEARATAVFAASDALSAAVEAKDLPLRMRAFDELVRQRRAYIAAVRDYNHEIANYALSVAHDGLSREMLVGMLIRIDGRQNAQAARDRAGAPASNVKRTSFEEPITDESAEASISFEPTNALRHEARRETPETTAAPANNPQRRYAKFESLSAPRRAQELAFALHPTPAAGAGKTPTKSLADCLSVTSDDGRRALVDGYWIAAERAARSSALKDRLAQLESLAPVALKNAAAPGAADAMLALEMRRAAAEALAIDADLGELKAAFYLGSLVGAGGSTVPLLPSSAPHVGRYQIHSAARSGPQRASPTFQRLMREMPTLEAALEDRAAAIISLERARTDAVAAYASGKGGLAPALDAIDRESDETLAFLEVTRRYNQAIGAYVFHVFPTQSSVEKLTAAMILKRANG